MTFVHRYILILMAAVAWPAAAAQQLRVMTHDSFALPVELIERFEQQQDIDVVFISGGDAGEALNRAILTRARPIADVLFGVDEALLERARGAGVFDPYASPSLERIPATLHIAPDHLVTPVDVGYVVPNVDVGVLAEAGFSLDDITLPELGSEDLAPLTVVMNPATSSPGLAFLMATVRYFGDPEAGIEPGAAAEDRAGFTDWLDFWAAMARNGVMVADGWSDAYYTAFSRYGGDRPVVVSYATSPAAEVIFAERELHESPTANLVCAGCAYRQVEGVGILAGTQSRAAAEAFIEFLLSPEVQAAIPLEMFVAPVVADVPVPEEFELYGSLPASAVAQPIEQAAVSEHQERWLEQWTAVVLQGRDPASVR